ncbi:MAG: DUF6328 family protein [Cellulomonas sp.]
MLTGFLLTLPFQQRFADLTSTQRAVYLALVLLATATTALIVAPVSLHRVLFRRHLKAELVASASRMVRAGLVILALLIAGTTLFVFDVVVGRGGALLAGGAVFVMLLSYWLFVPLRVAHRAPGPRGAHGPRRELLNPRTSRGWTPYLRSDLLEVTACNGRATNVTDTDPLAPDPVLGSDELAGALGALPDAVLILRAVREADGTVLDLQYVYMNEAAARLYGMAIGGVVGRGFCELFPSVRELGIFDVYVQVVASGVPVSFEASLFLESGREGSFWRTAVRFGDGVLILVRDITGQRQAEVALARTSRQYQLLAENASDVVMLLSPGWTFEWVSGSVAEVLGWQAADLVGRAVAEFVHPDDVGQVRQVIADTPEGAASMEFRFRRQDGTYRWVACRIRAKVDPDGTLAGVVGAMVDITDRKAAEAKLSFAAGHDPLTGLANRTTLLEETTRALAAGQWSGRTTALLMMDLDHFKNINDSLGHGVGDDLLRTVARRISASVRSVDLVARLGGDEFVILLRALDDPADAVRLAERLVVESREPITTSGTELYATASVGIAEFVPGVGTVRGAVDLIREADTAMYAAKVAGRNRIAQFNDDLRQTVDNRLRLEGDLRHALERDELAVWYQPEIDLHDGTVRAAEALLRWHHPDGELREAAQFIDIAEDSGLILDIGAWVLGQACADAAQWARNGPNRRVLLRVNLSPLELGQPDLLTTLDDALSASGLDPRLLCVEITEATILSTSSTVKANLDAISARGIELAIDDFGTGYGSLTYLRRYPIDVLKVDRSFVSHITTDINDRHLVAGIVALADRLGISVTAEGIETPDQGHILDAIGCAGAQGYLYSRALPIKEWTEFLRVNQTSEQN